MARRKDEKRPILIFGEIEEQLEDFTDEELGQVFKAILAYANRGEEMEAGDRAVRCLFKNIKQTIDRNDEAYDKKCETNRRIAEERERRRKEAREKMEKHETDESTQTCTTVNEREQTSPSQSQSQSQSQSITKKIIKESDDVVDGGQSQKGDALEKEINEMKGSQTWMEQMQMRHKQTESQLTEWLNVFVSDCRCRGTERHDTIQNAKRHFNDWLRIQLTKNNGNESRNGNPANRADAQHQRITEYAAVAAEFRNESNCQQIRRPPEVP